MNSTSGPLIPAGYAPPLAVVTPTDHAAWILIATALGLACSLTFCAIRVFVRVTISPNFGMDDYSVYAGTVLAIIQSALVFQACNRGLGMSFSLLEPSDQIGAQQLYYASNLFLILSLCFSKLSIVFFFLRLSPVRRHKLMFSTALILVIGWAVGSFFALALQCDLSQPWISLNKTCPNMQIRWTMIGVFGMLFEVTVVAMALFLVWDLQSSLSSKVIVVVVFSFRLLMIIPIAFQITTFDQSGWTTDPLLLEATFIAWSQTEMNYSLIAATIPSFQSFLKNLNTQFGGIGPNEKTVYAMNSANESRIRKGSAATYEMSRMRSVAAGATIPEADENVYHGHHGPLHSSSGVTRASSADLGESRPSAGTGRGDEMVSLDSDESARMMIRKDVAWSVNLERSAG